MIVLWRRPRCGRLLGRTTATFWVAMACESKYRVLLQLNIPPKNQQIKEEPGPESYFEETRICPKCLFKASPTSGFHLRLTLIELQPIVIYPAPHSVTERTSEERLQNWRKRDIQACLYC